MPTEKQLLEVIALQTEIARQGLDLAAVMTLVAERTPSLIQADGAIIELLEGEDMVYKAASGIAAKLLGTRIKRDHSLSGLCAATGQTVRCDDSETDSRLDSAACLAIGVRSMVFLPLAHNIEIVGVLKAMSLQPGKFSARDETLLGLLSKLIAASMFHATKFDPTDLLRRATRDDMTGLLNRAAFMERLMALAQGDALNNVCILIIDMDGLKPLNDRHGHHAGDAALRELAARLRKISRHSDTVARLGGDEFGMLVSPLAPGDELAALLARIEASLSAPFHFEGHALNLRSSMGTAHYPDDGLEPVKLLKLADQRMYAVKQTRSSR